MSMLHDRLVDLAADAPAATPDPGLWDRAARVHRRRRAGTAALAAVAVLAVLSLVGIDTWQRSPGVDPAAPGSAPALPARFYAPSPWLPGTDGEPTGPLAAVMTAERKGWFSSGNAAVGVSATTGEYRFLELPDDAGRGWALSPDGSRVAYWLTGDPSASPQTSGGQEVPVVGLAVWDAVTGEVVRHQVETEHGLAVDDQIVWADSAALVTRWAQWRVGDDAPPRDQGGAIDRVGLRVWEPDGPVGPVALGMDAYVDAGNGEGQVLLSWRRRSVLDVRTGKRSGPDVVGSRYGNVSALSPDGSAVAYPRGNKNPNRLVVARTEAEEPELVLDDDVWAAVAWIDEDTIAFTTRDTEQDPTPAFIETLSLSTGERSVLIDAGPDLQPGFDDLATDLLAVAPRDFPEPDRPWDPRLVAGLVGFVALVAGLWVLGWRRRVEA
ncbi:hypothetical protein [Nocardioides ginkgobilobae]